MCTTSLLLPVLLSTTISTVDHKLALHQMPVGTTYNGHVEDLVMVTCDD